MICSRLAFQLYASQLEEVSTTISYQPSFGDLQGPFEWPLTERISFPRVR
jgi:hypothetical protein